MSDTNIPADKSTVDEPTVGEPTVVEPTVVEPISTTPAGSEPPPLVEPAEPIATDDVVVVPAHVSETEPVVATTDPAAAETVQPVETGLPPVAPDRVVYVDAAQPPRKKGNRGVGVLLAILAAIVFGALYAVITAIVDASNLGAVDVAFLSKPAFWVPVLFFAVGFILLVLIANRANWWAYVIGSLLVALFVYFGSVFTLVLANGILAMTPAGGGIFLRSVFVSPGAIVAALLAREIALWTGAAIAARGRRVRARNIEAREAFERDEAEAKAKRDAAYAPPA